MELAGNVAYADIDSRESVLSRWFDAYGTDVLRLCCFYLGRYADAEDAVQETFLKVWRHMEHFQGRNGCSPKAWLMKIACNTCRDQLRRAWRKHEVVQADWADFEKAAQEDRELILDVMALPEKFRVPLLLFYLQRVTVREIADALRVSPATVSRRLEKARGLLKS